MYKSKIYKTEFKQIRKKDINSEFIRNFPTFCVAINDQGQIIFMNRAMLETLGYREKEVIGQNYISMFIPEREHELLKSVFKRHVEHRESTIDKNTVLAKDGREFNIDWHGWPVIDEKGNYAYQLGIGIDITEQKKMEEVLRESERKQAEARQKEQKVLRNRLFESSVLPIVVMEPIKDRFIDCNAAAAAIYGYASVEETLGKTLLDVSAPFQYDGTPSRVKVRHFIDRGIDEGSVVFEWRHQRPDGTQWDAEVHLASFSSGDTILLQFTLIDITKRKRTEEKLRENEEVFRILFERSGDAHLLMEDNRFFDCNEAALKILGYPDKSMIMHLSPVDISPERQPDGKLSPEKVKRLLKKALNEGSKRFEWVHQTFDGMEKYVDVVLTPISLRGKKLLYVTWRDITARKRAEEALRQSEATLQSVFNAAPVGICIMKDRVFQSANKVWYELFGYSETGITGHRTRMLYENEEEYDRVGRELYASLSERGLAHVQTRLRRKDGAFRDALLVAAPLQSEDLSLGTVVTIEDITERKQAADELRKSEERFRLFVGLVPAGIVISDSQDKVIYVNKKFVDLFGYTMEDMPSANEWWPLAYPDETLRNSVIQEWRRSIDEARMTLSEVGPIEYPVTCKKGMVRQIEFRVATTGDLNVVVFSDITERRHMEEEVQKSEAMYRAVVEDQTELICRWLSDGTLTFVNNAYCRFFDKQRHELIGKSFTPLIPAEDHHILKEHISLLTSSSPSGTVEHRVIASNGELRWMQWNNNVILGLESQIWEYQSVGRDITERKQLEEALHESRQQNEFFANIIRLSSQPFAMAYAEGRIDLFNSAYEKLTGYSADELRTLDWATDLTPPEWHETEQQKLTELHRTGQPVQYTKEYIRKDGSRVAIELLVHLVSDREGIQGYYAFVNDITDRKRAEAALRESEDRFRAFMDNSPGFAWIKDEDGHFIFLSKSCQQRFGLKDDDWHGKTDFGLWPGKTAGGFRKNDLAVLHDGQTRTVLEEFLNPDGTVSYWWSSKFLLEDTNGRKYVGGSGVDITERKQAEEALRESQERFRSVLENSLDVAYQRNLQRNCYDYMSPVIERITGWSVDEMCNIDLNTMLALIHPDDVSSLRKKIEKALTDCRNTGQSAAVAEYRLKRKDGTYCWLADNFVVLSNNDGQPLHLQGVIHNVTERKMMADRLKRLETMEVLGKVAGGVAHDLNNVLGVMVGYSEVLMDQMDAHQPLRKSLQTIMDSGQRAAAIVQDLLIMTRRGVVIREPVNLNQIISHYLYSPEFINLAGFHEGIHLETDMESTLMNLSGSDIHLHRTIMNLVTNALEATPKDGSVTIKTENRYLDVPVYGYEEIGKGEYVVLSISDTGEGISPENIQHIFEPFYTTKQMRRGSSGLGLSVVWGVVKDHDGYVDVQSKEGEGTTFKLYFPISRKDLPKAIVDMIAAKCTGHNESILVVDDEKGQCELATMILSRVNYDVMSVSSGEEAVEYLKSHQADLVILDMLMEPGMDGLDTYKEIMKIHPGQKAIIVSGFSETERTKEAQRLGAGAFVRKPYLAKRLCIEVSGELNRR